MGSNHYYEATDMEAAIAKRLTTIAMQTLGKALKNNDYAAVCAAAYIPDVGAALIRAGKQGARVESLQAAAGCADDVPIVHTLQALESGGFAMQWTGDVWRLDTVQILAREERAAIEALERASKEQDAAQVAAGKENAPAAQKGGKNGGR